MDTMANLNWCNYEWKGTMEGGRIVHPDSPWYWCSLDTIKNKNGVLELWIKRNKKEVKYWDGKIYKPVIEASTMRSITSFSYGLFSVKIMLPTGLNLWPSFWLSGEGNWPPEIDIMEAWSDSKGSYFRSTIPQFPYLVPGWKTTTNVHYLDSDLKKCSVGSRNISWFRQCLDPTTHFVEYTCIWLPDSITFLADGTVVRKITGKVCKDLVNNLKDPEKGFRMNVIFNVWCENPANNEVKINSPMKIKEFRYEPYYSIYI